ncbi:hypothetical protein GOV12_00255 [Candidatus Pacearchaeota archaeon]|nr:hypothetical protein [Candidatus Pacearchaeota archaeon]
MEKKESKFTKKRKMIVIISLIVIIVILSVFLYSNWIDSMSLFETQEFEAHVEVSNIHGFEVNGTALKFGTLPLGGLAKKSLVIKNDHEGYSRIKIFAKGKIRNFLNVSENGFVLAPNQSKEIVFRVRIPKNAEFGNYTGKVVFEIRNAIVK